MVRLVDKHGHPLLPRAMSIHGTTRFPGAFDFNTVFSSANRILWISPLNYEIGMTVEMLIFYKRS